MNSPGVGRSSHPHWRKLYEAAVLELDTTKLQDRIEDAKHAIHARMGELPLSDQNDEWETLSDALNVLDDLLGMDLARMDMARREKLKRKAEH